MGDKAEQAISVKTGKPNSLANYQVLFNLFRLMPDKAKKPITGQASVTSGHRARLRARLCREPLDLSDLEVLELLLASALPRKDTKALAAELLQRFGSIRGFMDARGEEVLNISGFGLGLECFRQLLREFLARYAAAPLRKREILATPEAVARMARQRLAGASQEEAWLALVDAQNRLFSWDRLLRGSASSVAIQPRDVLGAALAHKANGLILVHNHPGGDPTPSSTDLELTRELQSLSPSLGLRFLDHVIVTEADCYSIFQQKLIPGASFLLENQG